MTLLRVNLDYKFIDQIPRVADLCNALENRAGTLFSCPSFAWSKTHLLRLTNPWAHQRADWLISESRRKQSTWFHAETIGFTHTLTYIKRFRKRKPSISQATATSNSHSATSYVPNSVISSLSANSIIKYHYRNCDKLALAPRNLV